MVTSQSSVSIAVGAMRAGATDFLVKPIAPDRLLAALDAATNGRSDGELRPLSEKIAQPLAFEEIVGSAPEPAIRSMILTSSWWDPAADGSCRSRHFARGCGCARGSGNTSVAGAGSAWVHALTRRRSEGRQQR